MKSIAAERFLTAHKLVLPVDKTQGLQRIGIDVWVAPVTLDRTDPTIERGPRWITYSVKAKWQLHTERPVAVVSKSLRAMGYAREVTP